MFFTVQLTVQRSSIDFKMNYNSESVTTIENLDAAMIFAMFFRLEEKSLDVSRHLLFELSNFICCCIPFPPNLGKCVAGRRVFFEKQNLGNRFGRDIPNQYPSASALMM